MVSRKKTFRRKTQRLYKMKGCNKKSRRKHFFGGDSKADMGLAYPSNNVPTVPNPFLAYTGKGGSCLNAAAYPSSGPPAGGFNFLNPQNTQKGGCGCGITMGGGSQRKGGCGPACLAPLAMLGGKYRRAKKYKHNRTMKGGSGNNGIPYPNGLVGSSWTPAIGGWPGVDGISGNRNYLELNTYPTDPQTAMIATGAQPPFSIGGRRRKRRQKGGSLSNFLGQDFINLGRQFQHGLGTAYNATAGYAAPVNPLPWKGQLPNSANLSTVRASVL